MYSPPQTLVLTQTLTQAPFLTITLTVTFDLAMAPTVTKT